MKDKTTGSAESVEPISLTAWQRAFAAAAVADPKTLHTSVVSVGMALSTWANHDDGMEIRPSRETLIAALATPDGPSERARWDRVQRAIKRLIDCRWLVRTRKHSPRGPAEYRLRLPDQQNASIVRPVDRAEQNAPKVRGEQNASTRARSSSDPQETSTAGGEVGGSNGMSSSKPSSDEPGKVGDEINDYLHPTEHDDFRAWFENTKAAWADDPGALWRKYKPSKRVEIITEFLRHQAMLAESPEHYAHAGRYDPCGDCGVTHFAEGLSCDENARRGTEVMERFEWRRDRDKRLGISDELPDWMRA